MVAQTVKNLPAVQETSVQSLGWKDPLEKEMATTPVFLPEESHGQRSLVGSSSWDSKSWMWLSNYLFLEPFIKSVLAQLWDILFNIQLRIEIYCQLNHDTLSLRGILISEMLKDEKIFILELMKYIYIFGCMCVLYVFFSQIYQSFLLFPVFLLSVLDFPTPTLKKNSPSFTSSIFMP